MSDSSSTGISDHAAGKLSCKVGESASKIDINALPGSVRSTPGVALGSARSSSSNRRKI